MTPSTEKQLLKDVAFIKTALRKKEEVWLTKEQVKEMFNLEAKTLYAYKKEGKIKTRSLPSGKKIQYEQESIENLMVIQAATNIQLKKVS